MSKINPNKLQSHRNSISIWNIKNKNREGVICHEDSECRKIIRNVLRSLKVSVSEIIIKRVGERIIIILEIRRENLKKRFNKKKIKRRRRKGIGRRRSLRRKVRKWLLEDGTIERYNVKKRVGLRKVEIVGIVKMLIERLSYIYRREVNIKILNVKKIYVNSNILTDIVKKRLRGGKRNYKKVIRNIVYQFKRISSRADIMNDVISERGNRKKWWIHFVSCKWMKKLDMKEKKKVRICLKKEVNKRGMIRRGILNIWEKRLEKRMWIEREIGCKWKGLDGEENKTTPCGGGNIENGVKLLKRVYIKNRWDKRDKMRVCKEWRELDLNWWEKGSKRWSPSAGGVNEENNRCKDIYAPLGAPSGAISMQMWKKENMKKRKNVKEENDRVKSIVWVKGLEESLYNLNEYKKKERSEVEISIYLESKDEIRNKKRRENELRLRLRLRLRKEYEWKWNKKRKIFHFKKRKKKREWDYEANIYYEENIRPYVDIKYRKRMNNKRVPGGWMNK